MLSAKYIKLLAALQQQTDQGQIKWEKTSSTSKYKVIVGAYTISVWVYEHTAEIFAALRTDPIEASLELVDSYGNEFDTIKVYSQTSEEYNLLYKLYNSAHRSALDIDSKIDDILNIMGV